MRLFILKQLGKSETNTHSARFNPNSRTNFLFTITSWIWFGWAVMVFEGVGGGRGSRFYIYLFCGPDGDYKFGLGIHIIRSMPPLLYADSIRFHLV